MVRQQGQIIIHMVDSRRAVRTARCPHVNYSPEADSGSNGNCLPAACVVANRLSGSWLRVRFRAQMDQRATVFEAELIARNPGGMTGTADFQPVDSEKGIEQTRFFSPPSLFLVLRPSLVVHSPAPFDPQSYFMG